MSVWVTGLGIAAPTGLGVADYWAATLAGRTGIRRLSRFDPAGYPAVLAGEIDDFRAGEHLSTRLLTQTDVSTQFGLVAAAEALSDAALRPDDLGEYRAGVITSNATGGFAFTHEEFRSLWSRGPEFVSVYESFAWFYAVNTGQISIRHGLRGPGSVLVAEQAGGLDAIGHARRTVRAGTPLVVTGGVDSSLDPWGWLSHYSSGRVSTAVDPDRAYLPFDRAAGGYVPGEGGAILLLEDAAEARARNVPVYGSIAGYAATFDPAPGSDRPPALHRAAELALADAGLHAGDIDVVFADAAGVPELDEIEADTLVRLFGPRGVPVTAPKARIGRLYAGGGPLDVATALLSLRDGVIPPTAEDIELPPHRDLDVVVGEPRPGPLRTALVLARGRHGFNSAIVVGAVPA